MPSPSKAAKSAAAAAEKEKSRQPAMKKLTAAEVAHKYCKGALKRLLLACDDAKVRKTAKSGFRGLWGRTGLTDRPFFWALINTANESKEFRHPDCCEERPFKSPFPCLFYNYDRDRCSKPAHAPEFHFCMLCWGKHPLMDWDLTHDQTGSCKSWKRLKSDFEAVTEELKVSPDDLFKLFRAEVGDDEGGAVPTIEVEGPELEPRQISTTDLAEQYARGPLKQLILACNDVSIRRKAAILNKVLGKTGLKDRPFFWALINAANAESKYRHPACSAKPPFKSAFPCLFFNYGKDHCKKSEHAAEFHFCMLCWKKHSLEDWDLTEDVNGTCVAWRALKEEFDDLCRKTNMKPEDLWKAFRADASDTDKAPITVTIYDAPRVKKEVKAPPAKATAKPATPPAATATPAAPAESATKAAPLDLIRQLHAIAPSASVSPAKDDSVPASPDKRKPAHDDRAFQDMLGKKLAFKEDTQEETRRPATTANLAAIVAAAEPEAPAATQLADDPFANFAPSQVDTNALSGSGVSPTNAGDIWGLGFQMEASSPVDTPTPTGGAPLTWDDLMRPAARKNSMPSSHDPESPFAQGTVAHAVTQQSKSAHDSQSSFPSQTAIRDSNDFDQQASNTNVADGEVKALIDAKTAAEERASKLEQQVQTLQKQKDDADRRLKLANEKQQKTADERKATLAKMEDMRVNFEKKNAAFKASTTEQIANLKDKLAQKTQDAERRIKSATDKQQKAAEDRKALLQELDLMRATLDAKEAELAEVQSQKKSEEDIVQDFMEQVNGKALEAKAQMEEFTEGEKKRHKAAIRVYADGIRGTPEGAPVAAKVANVLYESGFEKFDEALELLKPFTGQDDACACLHDKVKKIASCRKLGNELFKMRQFSTSISAYSDALDAEPRCAAIRKVLLCNRAAAHKEDGAAKLGIDDCTAAIELDPEYAKAYGRRARCHQLIDDVDAAIVDYQKAIAFDPSSSKECGPALDALLRRKGKK